MSQARSSTDAYDSPFAQRQGKDLEWSDLSYTVHLKKGKSPFSSTFVDKHIISNTWGKVPGGQVCCILGPSGAGKSSLLNVLAGRVTPNAKNIVSGSVSVNGESINPVAFKKQIAYVMQDDALQPTLTPREALRFSAALRIPSSVSASQKEKLVDTMLKELGLSKCADTLIGGALIKGVSGGERKRTSVGVELVTNPSLVFLDEPTSGLDSYSAYHCVDLLRKVARAGSTVLCTIHQPASDVFQMFDHCILLKDGHIVYQGGVKDINAHFSSHGKAVPEHFNPADHIMNVVQQAPLQDLQQSGILMSSIQPSDPSKSTPWSAIDSAKVKVTSPGFFKELSWLLWREVINVKRDVGALIGRFAITIFLHILFGLIFEGAGGRDDNYPDNLSSHFGALTMVSISAMFGTAQSTLLAFPAERPIFLREYSTGTYGSTPYFFSKVASELPLAFLQNLVAVMIIYWLMDLDGNFFVLTISLWLLGAASSSVAMLLGSAVRDVSAAAEAQPAVFVPQILFAGFFIRIEQIPVYLRWVQYVCSLKYGINLVIVNEFKDCPNNQAACDALLEANDVDEDLGALYAFILIGLFLVFRVFALMLLTQKAKSFY